MTSSSSFASVATVSVKDLLMEGDRAFLSRGDEIQARLALSNYREAVHQSMEKDPEALWRLSMGCYFVGLRLIQRRSEKVSLFKEGRDAGQNAIALKPDCAACEFWTAMNMALYGEAVGVVKMLFSVQEIEAHLKRTLELYPGYAHAGAFRLLGLIEQKLPGIFGGSNDRAFAYFHKAIDQAPDEPLNYQFLAALLFDDMGKKDDARKIAEQGLALPEPPLDRLESREAKRELGIMLGK